MVLKYAGRAGNKYPVQSKYGYLPEYKDGKKFLKK